jgi:diacylglycerol kinase family enzyme
VPGIGVVVNPRAGGNRRVADRARRLGRVVGRAGWVCETPSLDDLPAVAAECRRSSVDVLAVCGGDGTYSRTLSALMHAYDGRPLPTFLPLRAGTMNTVARAIGAPAWQPERMLAEIVAEYSRGGTLEATDHQLLSVNGSALGFMVGAGVIVGFLRAYYDNPRRGALGGAEVLARLAFSALVGGRAVREAFEWLDADVFADGVRLPFDHFSVVYASTIENIGLGFRPTYRARERLGRFHVFAGPIEARELVRCLPRIRRALPTGSPQVYDATASRLELGFRRRASYMIDGEIMDAGEGMESMVVECGPVLRVIRR